MEKTKLLIATTNPGKLKEIKSFLMDLPFEFLSLRDLDFEIEDPEETGNTVQENSMLKARYYAEKTGFISLADDGGIFLEGLDGWPGIKAARVGNSDQDRRKKMLDKMQGIKNRNVYFNSSLALYNPEDKSFHLTYGKTNGEILEEDSGDTENGFGYDPIFYVTEKGKRYSEMTMQEKNACSHRGKALIKMKYFLQNNFGSKHIVVPFALIIKDGKILMNRRNDPHRPKYHEKWEFPGGSVDFGETMHGNVVKEVGEEAGYDVEVLKLLQHISIEEQQIPNFKLQIYLVPYVCKIVGGNGDYSDAECLESSWFELGDVLNNDLIGENARVYEKLLPELKKFIEENNL